MKSVSEKIFYYLSWPYRRWKVNRDYKKKLKELREKDAFIYK